MTDSPSPPAALVTRLPVIVRRLLHTQRDILDKLLRQEDIGEYDHAYHHGGIDRAIEALAEAADALQAAEQENDDWRRWSRGRKPNDPLLLDYNQMILEVQKAEAACRTLRARVQAVESYLQHQHGCEMARYPSGRVERDTPDERATQCTCGLAEKLALLHEDV